MDNKVLQRGGKWKWRVYDFSAGQHGLVKHMCTLLSNQRYGCNHSDSSSCWFKSSYVHISAGWIRFKVRVSINLQAVFLFLPVLQAIVFNTDDSHWHAWSVWLIQWIRMETKSSNTRPLPVQITDHKLPGVTWHSFNSDTWGQCDTLKFYLLLKANGYSINVANGFHWMPSWDVCNMLQHINIIWSFTECLDVDNDLPSECSFTIPVLFLLLNNWIVLCAYASCQ